MTAQWLSHLFLVAGTIIAVLPAAYNAVWQRLPEGINYDTRFIIANLAAGALAVMAAKTVDGLLKHLLPFAIAVLSGKKDQDTAPEKLVWFDRVSIILCCLMLVATGYMNYTINPEVVDLAAGEADTKVYEHQIEREQDRYYTTLQEKQQLVADNRRAWEMSQANRESIKVQYIREKLGSNVADLYVSGNGWAISKYRRTINEAGREAGRRVSEQKAEYDRALASLEQYESTQGESAASIVGLASQKVESESLSHEARKGRFLTVFNILLLIALITFVLSTYMSVRYQIVSGDDFSEELTAGNIARGGMRKAGLTALRKAGKALGVLDDRGNKVQFALAPTPAYVGGRMPSQRDSGFNPALTPPSQKRKSECKTGRCATGQNSGSDSLEVRKPEPESQSQKVESERVRSVSGLDSGNGVEGWPEPGDKAEWKKLLTKARGWSEQAYQKRGTETGERNMDRWNAFVGYAKGWGYSCSRSDLNGKACITLGVSDNAEEAVTMNWNVNGDYVN